MRLSFSGRDVRCGRLMTRQVISGRQWRPEPSCPTPPPLSGRTTQCRCVNAPPQLGWWGRLRLTAGYWLSPGGPCLPIRLGTASWKQTSRQGGWRPLPRPGGQNGQMPRWQTERVPPWLAARSRVPPRGACPLPHPVWHGPFGMGVGTGGSTAVTPLSVCF